MPPSPFFVHEKKRERILTQAKKEEAAYESHKRSTRLTHVQMQPQRLGSGEERLSSLPDVRARQQRQLTQQSKHGPFRAAENVRNTRLQAAKEENAVAVEEARSAGKGATTKQCPSDEK